MEFKGYKYSFDNKTSRRIEELLPRLKYSVLPNKIIRWLENFQESEIELAIDLLSVFEYIPFNEFMSRLNELLFEILKDIPIGEKIIIFPYGKVGKSGTLVTYPLKNTTAYSRRKYDLLITHDLEMLEDIRDYNHIIFIDDFIGSGKTFIEEFIKVQRFENWIDNSLFKNIFLLSAVMMEEGKAAIETAFFSRVQIHAEVRSKIFLSGKSPLTIFLKSLLPLKTIASRYGSGMNPANPLGFDNGQSLISFFHGTPDNTLPIIWEHNKWFAIYPRDPKIRMDEASNFKKDIAFYISIFNRLGIDLFTGKSIIEKIDDRYKRISSNSSNTSHSIVALLHLKEKRYDNLLICYILGITRIELKRIYLESKMKGLIDLNYELSPNGYKFLEDLKKAVNNDEFRQDSNKNLIPKDNLYVPNMFGGNAF